MTTRTSLAIVLGLALVGNGVLMLGDPAAWYGLVPGVPDTGPLNAHFVRDIGCAYLVTGSALAALAFDVQMRPAALAGAAFLSLHALVHLGEAIGGHGRSDHLLGALAPVLAPAALALWLAAPATPILRSPSMLKWLMRRQIDAFERSYGYDASYVREILAADTGAFLKLARVNGLGRYRKDIPRDVLYAAKLAGTLAEDCGPCTQLVVAMAEREGVAADVLRAILAGDERALSSEVALGLRFAKAVLSHDPAADALRAAVVKRWGARALVSLAFAVTAARIYPTVKYALGHGQACRRVVVDGAPVATPRQAA
jgi:hypothetical protein